MLFCFTLSGTIYRQLYDNNPRYVEDITQGSISAGKHSLLLRSGMRHRHAPRCVSASITDPLKESGAANMVWQDRGCWLSALPARVWYVCYFYIGHPWELQKWTILFLCIAVVLLLRRKEEWHGSVDFSFFESLVQLSCGGTVCLLEAPSPIERNGKRLLKCNIKILQ